MTEKQSLSSESSLARPLSPIDWEAVGNISRTDDKVCADVIFFVIHIAGDICGPGPVFIDRCSATICRFNFYGRVHKHASICMHKHVYFLDLIFADGLLTAKILPLEMVVIVPLPQGS